MKYYYAPMEGITDHIFRRAHQKYFPGIDRYYAPFFVPPQSGKPLAPKDIRELSPEHNRGIPLVPQILTNNAQNFLRGAEALRELGYEEVNLNLGCPSGTVCAKGKGAGFLSRRQELEQFLDEIFEKFSGRISIKTRLGKEDPEEFAALLELYHRYPVVELTIHPRVQKDFYKNPVRMEYWDGAAADSGIPLCLSGGIATKSDVDRLFAQRKEPEAIMLGRGLVANPALVMQIQGTGALTPQTLEQFHGEIFEETASQLGSPRNTMFRMKELWSFMLLMFDHREKLQKQLRKTTTLTEYQATVARILRDLPLREDAEVNWV